MNATKDNNKLTIARLADAGGVGLATVRYYQKRGLLAQPDKPFNGFRVYGDSDLERLSQIRGAQALGFTLAEIHTLLGHLNQGACESAKSLIEQKLQAVQRQIRDLKSTEKKLAKIQDHCRGDCIGKCTLLDQLRCMKT